MIKTLFVAILIALASYCYCQDTFNHENTYPDGIYNTKADFLKKTPNENVSLVAKTIYLTSRKVIDTIPDWCSFYYKEKDKRIKSAFAISYKGNLYFRTASILKNREKKDKSQATNFPNTFCRVLIAGKNYLYLELELANAWTQGLGYGMGGVAGNAIAQNAIKNKGTVWDFKNEEFNIFRSCKDYNAFIADKYPQGLQECEDQQPDILKVRTAIEMIK